MKSLIYLYLHTIRNNFKEKYFSKTILSGIVILSLFTLVNIFIGYFFGSIFLKAQAELSFQFDAFLNNASNILLYMSALIIFSKSIFALNLARKININLLAQFPVSRIEIYILDVFTGIIDVKYLLFLFFLISFSITLLNTNLEALVLLIVLLLVVSFVFLLHSLSELFISISKCFSYLTLVWKILAVSLFISILIFNGNWLYPYIKQLFYQNIIRANFSSLFKVIFSNNILEGLKISGLNILAFIILSIFSIAINTINHNLNIYFLLNKKNLFNRLKIKFNFVLFFLPKNIRFFIEKDIKYIFRSRQTLPVIAIELCIPIVFIFIVKSHFFVFDLGFLAVVIQTIAPLMIWNFYLSNSLGLEKKAISFLIYSNINTKFLLLSKNISYLIVRIPIFLASSIILCEIFSYQLFPIILALFLIFNFVLLTISNISSIKNPIPITLSEDSLSKAENTNNILSIIGLYIYIIFSALLFFVIHKFGNEAFYLLSFCFIAFLLIFYLKSISYSVKLFNHQKEIIYKKLTKI